MILKKFRKNNAKKKKEADNFSNLPLNALIFVIKAVVFAVTRSVLEHRCALVLVKRERAKIRVRILVVIVEGAVLAI